MYSKIINNNNNNKISMNYIYKDKEYRNINMIRFYEMKFINNIKILIKFKKFIIINIIS